MSPYIVGCQVVADVTAPDGSKILDFVMPETLNGRSGQGVNPVNPHTTRGSGEVRTCAECHRTPPSLGLGSGNYALTRHRGFVVTDDGVHVFAMRNGPSEPASVGTVGSGQIRAVASLPGIIEGTAEYLYVARGIEGVAIYDVRDGLPADPAGTISGINAIDVSRAARFLYVVVDGLGVQIYDNDDPTQAVLVDTVSIPTALRARPWGIHLYVAAGAAGLAIVDISDHGSPSIATTITGVNAADVALYAHYQGGSAFAARAYVADPDFGVRFVDLLPDVEDAMVVGGYPLVGSTALDTYVRYIPASDTTPSREHDFLYVAARTSGLYILDITQPDAIARVSALTDLGGEVVDVHVASHMAPPGVDDYAFLANPTVGLQVIDVSDPRSPTLATAVSAPGAVRALPEVQQLDRFIDVQGNQLKENAHPGVGVLSRADIVRILKAEISE